MSERFDKAQTRFAAAHAEDPERLVSGAESVPAAVAYHRRLVHWLAVVAPQASEAMRLAAHCQHLRRWTIRRADFPAGVSGYKTWRSTLARFHASEAAKVLADCGYDSATIARVGELLTKKGLKHDPDVQLFEDAICLVFVETQLAAFAEKHADPKVIDILRKTWRKMTEVGRAHATALAAALPERTRTLLTEAIADEPARAEGTDDADG